MTRAELLELFTPIYDRFTMTSYDTIETQHQKIFDVVVDPTKDYKTNVISGLGAWEQVEEDSDTGLDHFVIGYEDTITPLKYRKYFYITYEANAQNEYATLKSNIARTGALGRGGAARLELMTAGLLINSFTTAGADGQYLCSNSHPKNPEETGTTYDNLLSGAFSHDALETAEKQVSAEFFDLDGLPMAPYAGKPVLVYSPALRGPVGRVLSERADERPGVTIRDINLYSGKYTPIEWDFLGAQLGGSDTAWFIIYPMLKNLILIKNNAKLNFASWLDQLKQRYYFDAWLHGEVGSQDWRGLFGSTGL